MQVQQLYTNCLAHGAYYIRSGNEAAIIDPLREVQQYIDMAEKDGATIKYIFETHFHADFVSGHVTLAERTGGTIVYGPGAQTPYGSHAATDGETFEIGDLKIKVLHTPGHTLESSTFLLLDETDRPHAIFTGDTLFLGDVGRPDLAQKKNEITQDDLAGMLYDSLRTKIMTLPEDVIVYPGHGAGSACGKNMMDVTVDTLGNQLKVNYALRADMTKEEFIKEVTDGLLPPPGYFPDNVRMNKMGYDDIADVLSRSNRGLSPQDFASKREDSGVVVMDIRTQDEFVKSHVPDSLFVGLNGSFAPWVGELLMDTNTPILLVLSPGQEEEAITRLGRIGFDRVIGYLEGGVQAWQNSGRTVKSIDSISASEYASRIEEYPTIDVRRISEYQAQHVVDATNAPLSNLINQIATVEGKTPAFIHCAGGYRSVIAASLLAKNGIDNVINVEGGFKAIEQTEVPTTAFVCPSTLTTN